MSATDDASPSTTSGLPRLARFIAAAGFALLGGFAFATLAPRWLPDSVARFEAEAPWIGEAPSPSEWPRAARAGESVTVRGEGAARRIVVAGPFAAEASALASSLAGERTRGAGADIARRDALGRALQSESFIGPLYQMTPAAECAALLRAHARVAREFGGPGAADGPAPDAAEQVTSLAIEEAARVGDPALLSDALAASLIVERERLSVDAGSGVANLRERWESRMSRFAAVLEGLAGSIEAGETPLQVELAATLAPALAWGAAPLFPAPSTAMSESSPLPSAPRVRRIRALSLSLAAAGAVAGAALGFVLLLLLPRAARPRTSAARASRVRTPRPLDPGERGVDTASAWLQIVSATRPRDVARGVMEIAAHGAAAGGRVLVVDAGRRLAIHRAFEAEAGPGLVECLLRPLPALGVVQQGGAARVLLLAFGSPRRRPVWIALDRLLEEVRPHCDRLVLAVGSDAPREIGSVLAGRLMDGWWVGTNGKGRSDAARLSGRLGIAFHPLQLEHGDQPSLEMLRRRIVSLAPAPPDRVLEMPPASAEPAMFEGATPLAAPEVLDSDLQVRERLRFLAWMRRVQAEGRREELVSTEE